MNIEQYPKKAELGTCVIFYVNVAHHWRCEKNEKIRNNTAVSEHFEKDDSMMQQTKWCIRPWSSKPAASYKLSAWIPIIAYRAYRDIARTILVTKEEVLVTHITHLENFTSYDSWTVELCQPIQITSNGQKVNWNCQIIPAPSWEEAEGDDPHPPSWPTGGGKRQGGE